MRRTILPVVALALVLTAPASAAKKVYWYDRFYLWNDCRPVPLTVFSASEHAEELELRKEDIETTVRSRLRGARIYDDIPSTEEAGWLGWRIRHGRYGEPSLRVDIYVVGFAFKVEVEFRREAKLILPVPEGMDPLEGPATTWRTGTIGTHGGDASFILSSLSLHVDKFIDEYLRVNADACRNSN